MTGCPVLLIREEKPENFSKLMRPWLGPYVKQHCLFKSESVTHLSSTVMDFSRDALLSGSGKKEEEKRRFSHLCFWDTWWQCRLWWLMDDCVSRWIWVSFNELPTHSQMKMVVSTSTNPSFKCSSTGACDPAEESAVALKHTLVHVFLTLADFSGFQQTYRNLCVPWRRLSDWAKCLVFL